MKTKQTTFLLLILIIIFSCNKKNTKITNPKDYELYLTSTDRKSLDFVNYEIDFWQKKIDLAPDQFSYLNKLASNYSSLFELTANLDYLLKAEKLLIQSNDALKYTSVGSINSLARNYISQHRFREALALAKRSEKIGGEKVETQKLLFDVQMELGNYEEARKSLIAIKDFKNFDFLIRDAKWNDHRGDLDTAIDMIEKASKIAVDNNSKTLMVWTYSNLGDMYGHSGKIKESYEYYLKALKVEPEHSYSLKGIAWIVFSHEKNTKEAKRIIEAVSKKHNSPDFYLIKSQIAEFEKDTVSKERYLQQYFKMLEAKNYGVMYNKYNALLFADKQNTVNKALEIAKIEVEHRPTPDSYDLLAWSYFKLGYKKKALEIANKYIRDKTYEPVPSYHLAEIYKANNLKQISDKIKEELINSQFELGPNMMKKIQML